MSTVEDLQSIDLADPRLWDDGVPWDLFAAIQRDCPVHFSKQAVAPDEALVEVLAVGLHPRVRSGASGAQAGY